MGEYISYKAILTWKSLLEIALPKIFDNLLIVVFQYPTPMWLPSPLQACIMHTNHFMRLGSYALFPSLTRWQHNLALIFLHPLAHNRPPPHIPFGSGTDSVPTYFFHVSQVSLHNTSSFWYFALGIYTASVTRTGPRYSSTCPSKTPAAPKSSIIYDVVWWNHWAFSLLPFPHACFV